MLVISNLSSATRLTDLNLLARLLPDLYSTQCTELPLLLKFYNCQLRLYFFSINLLPDNLIPPELQIGPLQVQWNYIGHVL